MRAAYEQATQLFASCYRASGRPFICHLVGTASLLAAWNQPPAVAAAGLLHSAYLYGDFADGARRTKPAHRARLTAAVGAPTESLVFDFCQARREDGFTQWLANPHHLSSADRDPAILLLADLADDCAGGEPCYAPHKQYEAGLPWEPAARAQAVELAQVVIGSVAANELQARSRRSIRSKFRRHCNRHAAAFSESPSRRNGGGSRSGWDFSYHNFNHSQVCDGAEHTFFRWIV